MFAFARSLLVLNALVFSGPLLRADEPKKEAPELLPKELVAAWKKAGAEAAWSEAPEGNWLRFHPADERSKAGWLPAFRFQRWQKGALKELPAPETAFALDLSAHCRVTDEGLKELARFKHLAALDLSGTVLSGSKVSDEGVKELTKLAQLTSLDLTGTRVTDVGVKELAKLKQLTRLGLAGTKTTDAGLTELTKLGQLTWLNLADTEVTDAGLTELAKFKQLTALYLIHTKVTDAGAKELQKTLLKCKVYK